MKDDQEHLEEFHAKISLFGSFYIPLNIPRTPFNLIKSNLQAIPLNLYRNKCSKFKGGIQNAIMFAGIIFVDHYEMYQYVPKEFLGKKVLLSIVVSFNFTLPGYSPDQLIICIRWT